MPTSGLVAPAQFTADRVVVAASGNGWIYCAFVDTSAAPHRAMLVRQALMHPQYVFDDKWAIVGPIPVPLLTDGVHMSTANVSGPRGRWLCTAAGGRLGRACLPPPAHRRRPPSSWPPGLTLFPPPPPSPQPEGLSLAIHPVTHVPHVAFADSTKNYRVTVMRANLQAGTWLVLGRAGFAGKNPDLGAALPREALTSLAFTATGRLHVACEPAVPRTLPLHQLGCACCCDCSHHQALAHIAW